MPQDAERLRYDGRGRLEAAGNATFDYDDRGALSGCYTQRGVTAFSYGQDTLLDMAVLPGGVKIRYEYAGFQPVRRYRYLTLTGEYLWDGPQLTTYRDHDLRLEYAFDYTPSGVLDKVQLRPLAARHRQVFPKDINWTVESADWLCSLSVQSQRKRLWAYLQSWHQLVPDVTPRAPLTLYASCDQVGTVRLLTDRFGRVVKKLRHDSFGLLLEDSFPDLFLPIGFAGGLMDADTGLVRFGWRDYDPKVGRFTAPDPAKDQRGDGDIYDYCVDDPVSRVDPTGLWTRDTFNESRVSRDEQGQFSNGGSGSDLSTQTMASQAESGGTSSAHQTALLEKFKIQSSQLETELQKRFTGKDSTVYKSALQKLLKQTPNNASTEEREFAIELLILSIDTIPAAEWVQNNIWKQMSGILADEVAAAVFDDKIIKLAKKKGIETLANMILKSMKIRFPVLSDLFSPREANPLTHFEKKRIRESARMK